MQLPTTSTVPDFILELVRVAPEEWSGVHSKETAQARLKDLRTALLNPDILYVLSCLVKTLLQIPTEIESITFNGVHDVFNQQQLIGEGRGLRNPLKELEDIREKLSAAAQDIPN